MPTTPALPARQGAAAAAFSDATRAVAAAAEAFAAVAAAAAAFSAEPAAAIATRRIQGDRAC